LPVSKEDIVVRLFEAFSGRELTAALAWLHPEVVFRPMTAQVTQAGEPYRGHEGILRYAADIEAQWDELTLHPTQIRAAGNAVVALGLVSGRGHAGSFADAPTTWVFKFKDDLVIDAQIFSETRNVFEALVGEEVADGEVAAEGVAREAVLGEAVVGVAEEAVLGEAVAEEEVAQGASR
jgi:ketosteroid isomerase-like protein